jgi:hypothetical protein
LSDQHSTSNIKQNNANLFSGWSAPGDFERPTY